MSDLQDVVANWDDTEVARRWLMLCPIRKKDDKSAEVPNEFELNSIRNDPDKLKEIRSRLSNVSWWMRLLCQNIGMRSNQEDREVGKFFQASILSQASQARDEHDVIAAFLGKLKMQKGSKCVNVCAEMVEDGSNRLSFDRI